MTGNDAITITHALRGEGGRYTAEIAGEEAFGYLDWERGDTPDTRVATHTIVPPEIGGRGVAARLVERLVEDARAEGFRIVPQCWYVAKTFNERADWAPFKA
ncbi:MAG: GNAT family N-acetyltransferase [Pseudomonadota bacterium]